MGVEGAGAAGETVVSEDQQRELFVLTTRSVHGGRPPANSPYKGDERLRWTCCTRCADEIERNLVRPNASARSGSPRLYRGRRELQPPPPDPNEELPALDPMPADDRAVQLAVGVREAEGRLRKVEALVDAELRRLKSIQDEIAGLSQRRDEELTAQRDLIKALRKESVEEIERLNRHAREQQEKAFDLDNKAQHFLSEAFDGLGSQARNVMQIREALGVGLFANRTKELLLAGKDVLESIGENPLAQSLLSGLNAKIAAGLSSRLGEPATADDIQAQWLQIGRKYRERRSQLALFTAPTPAHPISLALNAGAAYAGGEVPWETVTALYQ